MLGVAEILTPFEGVLASRNAGDKSDMTMYVTALAKAGIAVVFTANPFNTGDSKAPIDLRTAQMKRSDAKAGAPVNNGKVLESWYGVITTESRAKNLSPRAEADGLNIGMNLGRSNIIAVDLDNEGDIGAFAEWWSQHTDEPVPTFTVRSPGKLKDNGDWDHRNGGHVYLWVPEGVDSLGLKGIAETMTEEEKTAQNRKGWAVMCGDGRGVLLPPSVRKTGAYTYTGVAMRVAPQWLIDILIARAAATTATDGSDIRDVQVAQWEDSTSWNDLLSPHGWELTGKTDSCGCPTWTRPGKGEHGAKSAVAHEVSCGALQQSHKVGQLYLYTDAGPSALRGEKSWSKLAFVAAMNEVAIPQARKQLGIAPEHVTVVTFPEGLPFGMSTGAGYITVQEDDSDDDEDGEDSASAPTTPAPAPIEKGPEPSSSVSDSTTLSSDEPSTEGASTTTSPSDDESDATTAEAEPTADPSLSVITFEVNGTEHTVDMRREMITSAGIVATPYPDDNPFGISPVTWERVEAEGLAFWSKRPFLRRIYAEAHRREVAPYALLLAILTHLANHIPYWHVLPTRIGDAPSSVGSGGSMNFGVQLMGTSAAGKSELLDIARDLLAPLDNRELGCGTGQALLKEFAEIVTTDDPADPKKKVQARRKNRDTVHLTVDEAGQLWKELGRQGSILGDVLRSMMMGKGISNLTSDRTRYASLRGGTYRLTMISGGQPGTFGPLFDPHEVRAGTPQRYAFTHASADKTVPCPASWSNEPLPVAPLLKGGTPLPFAAPTDDDGIQDTEVVMAPVPIPRSAGGAVYTSLMSGLRRACSRQSISETVTAEQTKFLEDRSIMFHSAIMWLRFETLLAVADGSVDSDGVIRPDLNPVYAELADDLMLHHLGNLARAYLAEQTAQTNDDTEEGKRMGARQLAANDHRDNISRARRRKIKARLVKMLRTHKTCTRSQLRGTLRSDERDMFDGLVEELIDDGIVVFNGAVYTKAGASQ